MSWPTHWLFGAPKSTNSYNRHQKIKQIDSLLARYPETKEIVKDLNYLVPLNLSFNPELKLNINLPNDYPSEKPIIKVEPPVKHPWVNEDMVIINAPLITKYNNSVELCSILKEIVDEFYHNVPVPLLPPRLFSTKENDGMSNLAYGKGSGYYPNLDNLSSYTSDVNVYANYSYNNKQSTNDMNLHGNSQYQTQLHPAIDISILENTIAKTYIMPEIPNDFPLINNMSVEELKDLNENEGKLIEHISKLNQIEQLTRDREESLNVIERLANENLTKKPVMEEKKKKLLENIDEINIKREKLKGMIGEIKSVADKYEPSTICMNLRIAANQMEEDSEKTYAQFNEGKINLDEFIQKFIDQRQLCHLRRIKEEKIHQIY